MNNTRMFLSMALLALGYLLWQAWQTDYHTPQPIAAASSSTGAGQDLMSAGDVPDAALPVESSTQSTAAAPIAEASAEPARVVSVETDVLSLRIDTRGGTIRSVDLLAYPKEAKSPLPLVRLLDDEAEAVAVRGDEYGRRHWLGGRF